MKKGHASLLLVASLLLNVVLVYVVLQDKNTPKQGDTSETTTEAAPVAESYESGVSYPLMRIVDGDTLVVGFQGSTEYVRLLGIDASEQNDPGGPECYATEASNHLREIAQTGTVVLHFDESQGYRDRHGRLLAYVELFDGTDLGEQMIRDGYVHEYTYNTPYDRQDTYKNAEREALNNETGLWAKEACAR